MANSPKRFEDEDESPGKSRDVGAGVDDPTVVLRPPPDAGPGARAEPLSEGAGEETTILRPPPDVEGDPEVDRTVARIRSLRDAGRTGEAFKQLNRAVRELGTRPVFKTLRYELGEALLERDAVEEETASRMLQAEPAPPAPPAAPPPQAAPVPGSSSAPFDATIRSTSAAAAPKPERPGPPVAHSSRGLVAVGLILVAVFALLVFVLTRRGPVGQGETEAEGVVAAGLAPGLVAIDAVPWAEVVSVERPGAQEEPPSPPSRFTPVILRLPPGEYRITLRYPPTGQEEDRFVRVESDQRLDQRVSFQDLDGKQYFARVGW